MGSNGPKVIGSSVTSFSSEAQRISQNSDSLGTVCKVLRSEEKAPQKGYAGIFLEAPECTSSLGASSLGLVLLLPPL